MAAAPAAPATGPQWNTGLFHCLDNLDYLQTSCGIHRAVYTLMAFTGFACLYSGQYRSRLRAKYKLEEAPCNDCIVHFCCPGCALCQERREPKLRGFEVVRGRRENDNQNRGVTERPAVEMGMAR